MQLYDMHSHILPGFDDGAKTIKESLSLIDCLKKQDVKNICFTPHFYTNEMSAEDFVAKRNDAFERFLQHKPDDVNIVLGAEVYVTRFLFGNDDLSGLTYGKSNYILTEFSYSSTFSEKTMNNFCSLIENHFLTPVLPHVERYKTLMKDPSIIRELQDMGVIIQSNVNNYCKGASILRKHKLLKYVAEGLIDILGTDAHSMSHNSPDCYAQAIQTISEKCGQRYIKSMMQKSAEIFNSAMSE